MINLVRPARAAALREFVQNRAHPGYLGIAVGSCRPCDVQRISRRLEQLAGNAQRVGRLTGQGQHLEVWRSRAGDPARPARLVVARGQDGQGEILAADYRANNAPPPVYLAEVADWELEEELSAMHARLKWEPAPLTAKDVEAKYGRRHIIYIPVDAAGVLMKVGETADLLTGRYPGDKILRNRLDRAQHYWVATVEVRDIRRGRTDQWVPAQKPQVQDVEHLIARRLSRGGAALPLHLVRKTVGGTTIKPLTAVGNIQVGSLLPTSLNAAYPDRPREPNVAGPRVRNNVAMATGDRYELG